MARWKLMNAHYLNVEDEEWEYTENDRMTGRPKRVKFPVPRLLDPRDPGSWTKRWGMKDNEDGEIIVCWQSKGDSSDVVFFGDPTPDMMPIDEEAKEVSRSFEDRWSYKPETAPDSYSQSLVDKFQIEMAEARSKPAQIEGLSELTNMLGKLVTQNAELIQRRV